MEESKIKTTILKTLPDRLLCGHEIYKARSGYEIVLCNELG